MNLSHWNSATDFTGMQAAALACGIDPANMELLPGKSLPLVQRMESCYISKRDWLSWDMGPYDEEKIKAKHDMLDSVSLRKWASEVEPDSWRAYCHWCKDDASSFALQRITRSEVARWLLAVQHNSHYNFDSNSIVVGSSNSNDPERTLGKRERETLLKIVVGMAIKGYAYNPNSAKNTATKDIATDLAGLGINVSDDTVRKYLREAVSTVLPATASQS